MVTTKLTFQQTVKHFVIQPGASPVRSCWYKISIKFDSRKRKRCAPVTRE